MITVIIILAFISHLSQISEAFWRISDKIDEEGLISNLKFETSNSNEHRIEFSALGQNFDYTLIPSDDIFASDFKLISVNELPNGDLEFQDYKEDQIPKSGAFYSVKDTFGSIFVDNENNQLQLDGIIDDNLRLIKKDPNSLSLVKLTWENPAESSQSDDEVEPVVEPANYKYNTRPVVVVASTGLKNVTVEVLILLDRNSLDAIRNSRQSVKKYLGIFWNSVQRRYAEITNPTIKFALTGVIIVESKLIQKHTPKSGHLDGPNFLDELTLWLYSNQKKIPKFDLAMVQTKLDLVTNHGNRLDSGLLGRAFVGGVCHVNQWSQKMFNCGISEDIVPVYSGVLTVAHEVAHLLGTPHDGIKQAINCPANDAYIMGNMMNGVNRWHFSPCSKKIMTNFINKGAECIRNKANPKYPIVNQLPGEIIDLNEICRIWYGEHYTVYKLKKTVDTCTTLRCFNPHTRRFYSKGAPPEGTKCGNNLICLNGKCVIKQ